MAWFEDLQTKLGASWPAIAAARARTDETFAALRDALAEFETETTAIVFFGSLGRGEMTSGSDADWALLIDGPSSSDHFRMAGRIGDRVRTPGLKSPGRTGTFGDLVSSHSLVHYIAGIRDTNENLTRRVLLLTESRAVGNDALRARVIQNVLERYVVHDPVVRTGEPRPLVPHFFFNDIVRYWRTITADFASKMWERDQEQWALKSVKLRFSRKLLFAWGLLAAFSFELFPPEDGAQIRNDPLRSSQFLAEFIGRQTNVTPIDMLSRVLLLQDEDFNARLIFDAYDKFLATVDNGNDRNLLESANAANAPHCAPFVSLYAASEKFHDGLNAVFNDGAKLKPLIRRYGLF